MTLGVVDVELTGAAGVVGIPTVVTVPEDGVHPAPTMPRKTRSASGRRMAPDTTGETHFEGFPEAMLSRAHLAIRQWFRPRRSV